MKKYFAVSDVHSCYKLLIDALHEKGFDKNNPEHILISCGDLLDRGDDTIKVLEYVLNLPEDRTILIKGNHEYLLEDLLKRESFYGIDISNGTAKTCIALSDINVPDTHEQLNLLAFSIISSAKENKLLKQYFSRLVHYAEFENHVFVHGWLRPEFRYANDEDWSYDTWLNGIDSWIMYGNEIGKIIVCGHINASYAHREINGKSSNKTFKNDDIICLDGMTILSNIVNCEIFEEDEI